MRFFLFLIPIIFTLVLGCNSIKHPEYVSKIDSLLTDLDSISLSYTNLNYDEIKLKYDSVLNNNAHLKQSETIDIANDTDLKENLFKYSRVQRSFKTFFKNHDEFINDIRFNKNQLSTLKTDISNNMLSKEEIDKYYNEELNAHKTLVEKLSLSTDNIKTSFKIYDEVHNKINDYIKNHSTNE